MSVHDNGDLGTLETGVDTVGFLAGLLSGYEPSSILREQAQNADDACRKQGRVGRLWVSVEEHEIRIENPSILTDDDWNRLAKTSSRGKAADEKQTGEFGVGFWSVLHLTDAPIVTSGSRTVRIDQFSGGPAEFERASETIDGTRFTLPLRREQTSAGARLEVSAVSTSMLSALEDDFARQIADLLLFTEALDEIVVVRLDGTEDRGSRTVHQLSPGIDRVDITLMRDEHCSVSEHLRLSSEMPNPPSGRNPHVTAAFPLGDTAEPGRVFCTFPTETTTGLPFSINAHFFAAMDRRSIVNGGAHGAWNDLVYSRLGETIGENLEALFACEIPMSWEARALWFAGTTGGTTDIQRRSSDLLDHLDRRAIPRAVVPNRAGAFHRGADLVWLDDEADELLGTYIENAAATVQPELRQLLRRWGVRRWEPKDVARWVAKNAPDGEVHLTDAPEFMNSVSKLKRLLTYLATEGETVKGATLAAGSDDRLYPLGTGVLRKPTPQISNLVKGLSTRGVHPELANTIAWAYAPLTDSSWFRDVLQTNARTLEGKRVPSPSIGCLSTLARVSDALELADVAREGSAGLPLAVDPGKTVRSFGSTTIVGVPSSPHRAEVVELLERCGARCLHESIDSVELSGGDIRRFSARTLTEYVLGAPKWNPVKDTLPLLLAADLLIDSRLADASDFADLTVAEIWPAADGTPRALTNLYLSSEAGVIRKDQKPRVLAPRAIDTTTTAGRRAQAVLTESLGRVRLDSTEETVAGCEHPPADRTEILGLLEDLVECWRKLRPVQRDRLAQAAFVPCLDGKLRVPADVLMPKRPLPGGLGDRSVANLIAEVGGLRRILTDLGASSVPDADELADLARWIAEQPLQDESDPATTLWDYLDFETDIADHQLHALSSIPWLPAHPGHERKAPKDLVDPTLAFADLLFHSPKGIRQSSARLRDALGIRGSLSAEEYVALAERSAETQKALPPQYFYQLDRVAATQQNAVALAPLRDVAFIPANGELIAPRSLVDQSRARLWGHLRRKLPDEFVASHRRLLAAVKVASDGEVTWRDHIEVLDELSELADPDERAMALARNRFESLGELYADGNAPTDQLVNRRCVPTSQGLTRPEDAYRADYPPSTSRRLAEALPVAMGMGLAEQLLDALPIRSLRTSVRLEPVALGERVDTKWPPRLSMHAENVHRYLLANGDGDLASLSTQWPPVVRTVSQLTIRALRDDIEVANWAEPCFLGPDDQGRFVLLLQAAKADTRSVADSIAMLFGVGSSKKTLLVQVLDSPTPQAGAEALDYDEVPPLRADSTVSFDQSEVEISIDDFSPVEQHPAEASEPVDNVILAADPEFFSGSQSSSTLEEATPDQAFELPAPERTANDVNAGAQLIDEIDPVPESVAAGALPPRPAPARVRSDWDAIASEFNVEQRFEAPVEDVDLHADEPKPVEEPRRRRCVLSFYDVTHGLLPLRRSDVRSLAGPGQLASVHIFGETRGASVADDMHVQIDGGSDLFQQRLVVPGVVVHLSPGAPGSFEATIHEDPHTINDVWILELGRDGTLHRERVDGVEVMWECEDDIYRPERRWEDVEALHAEATASGLDLIIQAFRRFGAGGLRDVEVWQLVALHRLFALSTIRSHLTRQTALFERSGERWHMTGDTVFKDVVPAPGRPRPSSNGSEPKLRTRARELARQLGSLLNQIGDEALREETVASLGLIAVSPSALRDIELGCEAFSANGDPAVLASVRQTIVRHPDRAGIVVGWLESPQLDHGQHWLQLLEVVEECGSSTAVVRAQQLRERQRPSSAHELLGSASPDQAEVAYEELLDGVGDLSAAAQVIAAVYTSVSDRGVDALFEAPSELLDAVVRLERIRLHDSTGVTDLDSVVAGRQALLGAALAALGDTDRHSNEVRQQALAIARLLHGDVPGVLDVMKEYGFLLRELGSVEDAAAVFTAADRFARAQDFQSATANLLAREATEGECSKEIAPFLTAWCEFAHVGNVASSAGASPAV
jgi:hypothetical protein